MRSIQNFDLDHQHWDDIAYPYGITKDGQIHEGREIVFEGSHVKLRNGGKIGIVCLGDFDASWYNLLRGRSVAGEIPGMPLLNSVKRLARALIANFPIRVLGGHKEYGDVASCPGSNLMPAVIALREELKLSAPLFRKL